MQVVGHRYALNSNRCIIVVSLVVLPELSHDSSTCTELHMDEMKCAESFISAPTDRLPKSECNQTVRRHKTSDAILNSLETHEPARFTLQMVDQASQGRELSQA